MRLLSIFLLFCVIFKVSESVYRVRKVVRNGNGIRRAVKDEDILDIEAAELIFKEKGLNKAPFSVSEKRITEVEKPENPKSDPFASPNSDVQRTEPKIEKPIETPIGAPAFQPTIDELKESLVEESTTTVGGFEDVEGQESELITTTEIPFARQTIGPNGEIPFDFNVDPDFPKSAPIARGLVGIPDGWNINKQIDEEFKRGFRSNIRA